VRPSDVLEPSAATLGGADAFEALTRATRCQRGRSASTLPAVTLSPRDPMLRFFSSLFRRPVALLPSDEKAAGDGESLARGVVAAESGGAPDDWTTERAVAYGLKASTWVYACCWRIAQAVASVPWVVETRTGGEWSEAPQDHELVRLWSNPNPLQSRSRLVERVVYNLILAGNGCLYKVRGLGTKIEELWSVNPDRVTPIPHEEEVLAGYRISKRGGGRGDDVGVSEIVHFMLADPANPLWGLGPLQVAAAAVDSDSAAREWQRSSFGNRATPDGLVSFKANLTQAQHAAAVEHIRATRQGPKNARSVAVLGADATWTPLNLSPVEMDFLQTRKLTREEICAVFQVPPPLVGIYENATLANLQASRLLFWEETILPLVELLSDEINRSLVRADFGEDVRLVADVERLPALRERAVANASTAQTYFALGVPFNAINDRLGLGFDPVEGGDVGFVASSSTPVAALAPATEGLVPDPYGTPSGFGEGESRRQVRGAWREALASGDETQIRGTRYALEVARETLRLLGEEPDEVEAWIEGAA